MMRAFSRAWASLIVVANEFQLFQPIGGVSASAVRLADVFFRTAATAGTGRAAAATVAMDAVNIRRRRAVIMIVMIDKLKLR